MISEAIQNANIFYRLQIEYLTYEGTDLNLNNISQYNYENEPTYATTDERLL